MNNTTPNPIVSVCVQTYNHQEFIVKCLDSILTQNTNFKYEIILGEDNSDDETRAICIEYAQKFPNLIQLNLRERKDVIYIEGKPTGRYNFTENLKSCRGKYIAICEGDDYWTDKNKLQKQVDFLEANKEVVGCFHNSIVVDSSNSIVEKQYFKHTGKLLYSQEECLKKIKSSYATCSLMFRRKLIHNQIKTYRNYFSDFFIELLITKHGDIAYLDENMSAYRLHSGGIWQGSDTIHNYKVILRRYIFLYGLKDFNLKYSNYLKERIIDFHDRIIENSTSFNQKWKYKISKLRFLNYSPKYLANRLMKSLHYRTKSIRNKK